MKSVFIINIQLETRTARAVESLRGGTQGIEVPDARYSLVSEEGESKSKTLN